MPTRTWLVDDTLIELVDRGGLGVTLRVGDVVTRIPPRTIGAWPIAVPGRNVHLEARRNLDVLRFFVFADNHPVPRDRTSSCDHAGEHPDGHHCITCLWAMFDDENARIRRVRRLAVLGSIAFFAVILAIGLTMRGSRITSVGAGGLVLTAYLTISSWRAERRERRAGIGMATDPRFAAPPEARVRR